MKGYFNDFRDAIGFRESDNRYDAVNTIGFIGRYQFGKPRLWDLGISLNRWKPSRLLPNFHKVVSLKDFLANHELQDTLFSLHVDLHMTFIRKRYQQYLNRVAHGILITESGLVAGLHLKGGGSISKPGVTQFLQSGKSNVDGYGTEITEYINKFGDYCLRYASREEIQEQFTWVKNLEIKPLDVIV